MLASETLPTKVVKAAAPVRLCVCVCVSDLGYRHTGDRPKFAEELMHVITRGVGAHVGHTQRCLAQHICVSIGTFVLLKLG